MGGAGEDLPVERGDALVVADDLERKTGVAEDERVLGVGDLAQRERAHALDAPEEPTVERRAPRDHRHLGQVHALVAHALDMADDAQEGGGQSQVGRDRRLGRQQVEHAHVDVAIAAVDVVVVGHHPLCQGGVAVLECRERDLEAGRDEVERAERQRLELGELPDKCTARRHLVQVRHAAAGA